MPLDLSVELTVTWPVNRGSSNGPVTDPSAVALPLRSLSGISDGGFSSAMASAGSRSFRSVDRSRTCSIFPSVPETSTRVRRRGERRRPQRHGPSRLIVRDIQMPVHRMLRPMAGTIPRSARAFVSRCPTVVSAEKVPAMVPLQATGRSVSMAAARRRSRPSMFPST